MIEARENLGGRLPLADPANLTTAQQELLCPSGKRA